MHTRLSLTQKHSLRLADDVVEHMLKDVYILHQLVLLSLAESFGRSYG
jgi:hypothetical protein